MGEYKLPVELKGPGDDPEWNLAPWVSHTDIRRTTELLRHIHKTDKYNGLRTLEVPERMYAKVRVGGLKVGPLTQPFAVVLTNPDEERWGRRFVCPPFIPLKDYEKDGWNLEAEAYSYECDGRLAHQKLRNWMHNGCMRYWFAPSYRKGDTDMLPETWCAIFSYRFGTNPIESGRIEAELCFKDGELSIGRFEDLSATFEHGKHGDPDVFQYSSKPIGHHRPFELKSRGSHEPKLTPEESKRLGVRCAFPIIECDFRAAHAFPHFRGGGAEVDGAKTIEALVAAFASGEREALDGFKCIYFRE